MRLVRYRGKWALRIGGVRRSTGYDATAENLQAAERAARDIVAASNAARAAETCREIVMAYLADMPLRANAKTPAQGHVYALRNALSFFDNHRPAEVTRDECRIYIAMRRNDGRADGTIRKELSAIAAALRWHDPQTPARFDLPPSSEPRSRFLSRDEFARLIEAAKTAPHVETFLHLAICTAGRKEAILGLQWSTHIDFEKRSIWLGFKQGGKRRATVPMTESAHDALRNAYEIRTCEHVIEWAGGPVRDIKRALKACYARAGLTGIDAPAHVLRHTAASWMAMDGVPMLEISRRLGHSSIAITEKTYAHLHPDYMQAGTQALEL